MFTLRHPPSPHAITRQTLYTRCNLIMRGWETNVEPNSYIYNRGVFRVVFSTSCNWLSGFLFIAYQFILANMTSCNTKGAPRPLAWTLQMTCIYSCILSLLVLGAFEFFTFQISKVEKGGIVAGLGLIILYSGLGQKPRHWFPWPSADIETCQPILPHVI